MRDLLKREPADRYDFAAYRKRLKLKKIQRIILTILSLVIILVVLVIGIYLYRNYDMDNLAQNLTGQQANTGTVQSNGFPVSLNGEVPQDLIAVGNSLVLQTQDEVIFVDSGGSTQHTFTHRYTNPVLKADGSRLLTYDRGGYSYRIDSSSGLNYSGRTEATLITGAISSRGSYALAVAENRSAGSVIVRSRSNEIILEWLSASDQIVDLAFSDNGSELAVACVGFEENRLVSKVYIFDVSSSTTAETAEQAVLTFENALPLALDYKSDGNIHLICDTFVGVINSSYEASTVSFSNSVYRYYFTSSDTILLTTDVSAVSFTLISIDRQGNKEDVQIRGGGNDIAVDDRGNIYLLERTSIQRFNSSLELLEEISVDSSIFSIATLNNTLYLLSDSQLARLSDLEASRAAETEG